MEATSLNIELSVGLGQTTATLYGPNGEYLYREYGQTMPEAVSNLMAGFQRWAMNEAIKAWQRKQQFPAPEGDNVR